MFKNFRGICGMWVQSSEITPELPLGKVIDLVVDPCVGKCVALWVKTIDGELKLLDFNDILVWRKTQISISSINDLVFPEEFPIIRDILDREQPIISAKVYEKTETSRELGEVIDFFINTNFPIIFSILVQKGWWVFGKSFEIPREKVLEINENGIFVENLSLKIKKEEKIPDNVVPRAD